MLQHAGFRPAGVAYGIGRNRRKKFRHENRCCSSAMKTVAITEWNGLISPLYDAACWLCVMRPDGTRIRFNVKSFSIAEKSELCTAEGVDVLICGAITAIALSLLKERGVEVVSWMCGSVDAVLEAYRKGEAITTRFAMPGYRKSNCRDRRVCRCRTRKSE